MTQQAAQPMGPPELDPSVRYLLSMYILGRKLGGGSFGTVREAQHIVTKQRVAIKILSRARISEETGAEDKVRREIHIMRLLSHPHIVRLYEVIETPRDIYLVLEYVASGELFDFLNERGRLHEPIARRYFQQLIAGVEACHAAGVVHRDLKPENLLLTADGGCDRAALKIADFGLSNILRDGHFLHTSCGSPNYAAPEVIAGRLYAGPEVDVWSAGCILFALLAGRLPFDDGNVGRLFRAIKAGAFTLPTHLSSPVRDLIRRMLTVDPLKRITIPEIRQHPWFAASMPQYLAVPPPAVGPVGLPPILDPGVLAALNGLGINPQQAADAVQHREYTPASVAYHLLADAARRAAGPAGQPDAVQISNSHGRDEPPGCCSAPSCEQPYRVAGGRWFSGMPLRPAGGAPGAIAAVLGALRALGCAWKRTSVYTYRCKAVARSVLRGRTKQRPPSPASLQQRQQPTVGASEEDKLTVKFEVQLYSVTEATYIVDLQRLQGNPACYLDICCALLSHLAAIVAANSASAQQRPAALSASSNPGAARLPNGVSGAPHPATGLQQKAAAANGLPQGLSHHSQQLASPQNGAAQQQQHSAIQQQQQQQNGTVQALQEAAMLRSGAGTPTGGKSASGSAPSGHAAAAVAASSQWPGGANGSAVAASQLAERLRLATAVQPHMNGNAASHGGPQHGSANGVYEPATPLSIVPNGRPNGALIHADSDMQLSP